MVTKIERQMSRTFMNRCYLSGPGTHEIIIEENAKAIAGYGFICWSIGVLFGTVATLVGIALGGIL